MTAFCRGFSHLEYRNVAGQRLSTAGRRQRTLPDPNPPVVNGSYLAIQSGIARLTRGLLVIVGAEAVVTTEAEQLRGSCSSTGRLGRR
jgi:hypothetical protein